MSEFDPQRRSQIIAFLESDDERLIKHAIQQICKRLEADRPLTLTDVAWAALSRHMLSPHILVRRWLYKVVGLTREGRLAPWLRGQLRGGETDPENLSWAVAAFFSLEANAQIGARLRSLSLDMAPHQLSARFFRPELPPIDTELERVAIEADEPLPPMWLALLHARHRGYVRTSVIQALTDHDDAGVSEYSVWALVRDPGGRFDKLTIGPGDIAARNPQVRRWLYRLLGKDPRNLQIYSDLIAERSLQETDPRAREGLALALGLELLDPTLAMRVAEWFAEEDDQLTKLALVQHVRDMASEVTVYHEVLEAQDDPTLFLPVQEHDVFVEGPIRMSAVPQPIGVRPRDSYLIGFDTVGFSKFSDKAQGQIVLDIYAECESDPYASEVPVGDTCISRAGDGAIAAFAGTNHSLVPLKMALRMARQRADSGGHQFRFGVHAGPVNWIELEDGQHEIQGSAVNWTARVMDAAEGGQILLSAPYYDLYAYPGRDQLDVEGFRKIEDRATKHGEPLPVYEVEW